MKIEAINKTQSQGILEMEYLGKQIGTTDASINNRVQKREERITSTESTIEEIIC